MIEEIFSGKSIRVRYRCSGSSRTFVIFNPWSSNKHPVNSGEFNSFGKTSAFDLGFNQINIESNRNDWFQCPEILEAIKVTNEVLGDSEVYTYGSSMGGVCGN